MKAYLLTAVGVIFLSVIISLLVPEGKLHKSITFIMRLVCILALVQPIAGVFKLPEISADSGFLDYAYISSVYSENQSAELEKLLLKEFECQTDCNVSVDNKDGEFSITSVEVALDEENLQLIDKIYEYLKGLEYINITVYAKST